MMHLIRHTCQKALRTIVILSIFSSCSKERYEVIIKEDVQPPVVEKAIFKPSTENPLATKVEAPFQKTINNPNDLNFTTTKGTIVKGSVSDFVFESGSWERVELPINLQIKELYTIKDMILNGKSTTSNGKLLTTGGQIEITATKDGKKLQLAPYSQFSIKVPTNNPDPEMKIFFGEELANGDVNWQLATMQDKFLGLKDSSKSAIVAIEQLYQLLPSKIGWINIDKFPRESTKLTTLTLTSEYPTIDDIICFLYFDRLKSILRYYSNGKQSNLPEGEHINLICIGITEKDEVYTFIKEFNLEANQVVQVKLEKSSLEELMKYLSGL